MEQGNAMLLDLSKIIQTPDSELPFRTELDLHDLEFGGNYPVQEPVLAEGSVRNTAGVLVLRGTVSTRLHAVCDRCAAEFLREVSFAQPANRVRMVTATSSNAKNFAFIFIPPFS